MKRPTRPFAAVAALALLVQSTGAASLPVAVLHATGAFPPPAARLAFFPPHAVQAAPSRIAEAVKNWFESAGVVARALMETAQEPSAPSARAAQPEEVHLIAAPPRAQAVEPATDRMLVVMEKGRRLESVIGPGERSFSVPPGAATRAFPTLPDFHEAWIEQGGLRAQVSYKNPHGIVTGNENGYRAVFAEGTERLAPVRNLTAPYRRAFPIYWHDETVEMELVIENNTGRTLRHVRVQAGQETFRPVGTEGRRTGPAVKLAVADELAPGARATARWSTVLSATTRAVVNLEQTHVRVTADAPDASAPATMLDAPQAGVVDPPGPPLMP